MIKIIEACELYCDNCNRPLLDEYEGTLFCRDVDNLEAYADASEWKKDGDEWHCNDCAERIEAQREAEEQP